MELLNGLMQTTAIEVFTPMERSDYAVGVPKSGTYRRILTTETGETQIVKYKAVREECDGRPYRLNIPLRPFESVVFEFPRVLKRKTKTKKK